jgi:heavy metal-binding protein
MLPPTPTLAGGAEAEGRASIGDDSKLDVYSCPIHPEVKETSPGFCPRCGMLIVKRKDEGRQP